MELSKLLGLLSMKVLFTCFIVAVLSMKNATMLLWQGQKVYMAHIKNIQSQFCMLDLLKQLNLGIVQGTVQS